MHMDYVEHLTASFLDELEKIGQSKTAAATSLKPATGLKRFGQLLTGSHAKDLAAAHDRTIARGKRYAGALSNIDRATDKVYKHIDKHPNLHPMEAAMQAKGKVDSTLSTFKNRADRLHSAFDAENNKVMGTQAATAVGAVGGVAAGVHALHKKKEKGESKIAAKFPKG